MSLLLFFLYKGKTVLPEAALCEGGGTGGKTPHPSYKSPYYTLGRKLGGPHTSGEKKYPTLFRNQISVIQPKASHFTD